MKNTLKKLIELQKVDTQLQYLERSKGDLPQKVGMLKRRLEEAEESLKDSERMLDGYRKEHGRLEIEIKAQRGRQEKYKAQLLEVKNNREYDAVTQEIEAAKAAIEQKENRLLELMDLEEQTTGSIQIKKEEMDKLKEQLERSNDELTKRLAKTEKEEIELKERREEIIKELKPRIVSTYNRIARAKDGLAVVNVVRGACGGCFKSLPPQKILEVRSMDKIYTCDICGRILVYEEDDSE